MICPAATVSFRALHPPSRLPPPSSLLLFLCTISLLLCQTPCLFRSLRISTILFDGTSHVLADDGDERNGHVRFHSIRIYSNICRSGLLGRHEVEVELDLVRNTNEESETGSKSNRECGIWWYGVAFRAPLSIFIRSKMDLRSGSASTSRILSVLLCIERVFCIA